MANNYQFEIKSARIARSGIYRYRKSEAEAMTGESFDSDYVNIYRPAIVLSNAVDKFKSIPLTLEHPTEFVNPENYQRLSVGAVMDSPMVTYVDGEVAIDNKIMIGSLKAYNALARGVKELSPGYIAKFKKSHGEYKGQTYDAIMTDIVDVNHFAITRRARGGHQTRILDSKSIGETKLKTGLFHRIFKSMTKDSKSFDEMVDLIAEGKETVDSIQGYMDTLPESSDKEMLSRYIEDLGNGTGIFEDSMLDKACDEIKGLYKKIEDSLDSTTSETKNSEEEEKEDKEDEKVEEKEDKEEETKDGCGSTEDSETNEEEEENVEVKEPFVEDSQEEQSVEEPIKFTLDSLSEEEQENVRNFIINTVLDSLSNDDSELRKALTPSRKTEYKRYSNPIISSANTNTSKGAIADYDAIRGR